MSLLLPGNRRARSLAAQTRSKTVIPSGARNDNAGETYLVKRLVILALVATILSTTVSAAPIPIAELSRTTPVDLAREIHPVFKRNCLACHNTTKAKSGLNLESPALIPQRRRERPAIVPGKSAESLPVKAAAHPRRRSRDAAARQQSKAAALTPEELALLRLWIDQGHRRGGE